VNHITFRKHTLTFVVLFVMSLFSPISGQVSDYLLTGKISYITSQNVYVKFESTRNILAGDTVFLQQEDKLIPLFIVENISSVSCVGKLLSNTEIKIDDVVAAKVHEKTMPIPPKDDHSVAVASLPAVKGTGNDAAGKAVLVKRRQDIQGSLSVSSYSNLSNTPVENSQRMRYTFSMRAANMANSRLSAESYISFSHKLNEWDTIRKNVFYALKIYSLAFKYDLSEKTNIWVGRRVNPSLSNIGAVDGLQAETTIGNFTLGAVGGSRPNDLDSQGILFPQKREGCKVRWLFLSRGTPE
jgi:hypothetical protein